MKKPKKQRPKAKQRAAAQPAASRRRAPQAVARTSRAAARRRRSGFGLAAALSQATHRIGRLGHAGAILARHGLDETRNLARTVAAFEMRPALARMRTEAQTRARALPFSHDEREVLALLFLPVLLVASAIVTHQSVRVLQSYVTSIALPDQEIAALRTAAESAPPPPMPATAAREVAPGPAVSASRPAAIAMPQPAGVPAPLPAVSAEQTETAVAPPATLPMPAPAARTLPPADVPAPLQPAAGETEIALLAPAPALPAAAPVTPDPLAAFEADEAGRPILPGICRIDEVRRAPAATASFVPPQAGSEAFGRRLAEAAEAQVGGFVIYNDAYRSIRYPMGDVNDFFGVCTDVLVRAYRALGLDLQALVHQARAGRGDANIDHRRTEVLRRFFATHGESLPPSTFPEDYRPGDIVTYHRPQNTRSRSHIAIVSSQIAPSGRPMIVHNRGWGPQLEDALFVDEITGHYRYEGPSPTRNADAAKKVPRAGAPVVPVSLTPGDANLRAE